jgi:hypothetical protein
MRYDRHPPPPGPYTVGQLHEPPPNETFRRPEHLVIPKSSKMRAAFRLTGRCRGPSIMRACQPVFLRERLGHTGLAHQAGEGPMFHGSQHGGRGLWPESEAGA